MNFDEKCKDLTNFILWAYSIVDSQLQKVLEWETDNKHMVGNNSALRIERGGWNITGIVIFEGKLFVEVEFNGWEFSPKLQFPVNIDWADKVIKQHQERYMSKQARLAEETAKKEMEMAKQERDTYERLRLKFEGES